MTKPENEKKNEENDEEFQRLLNDFISSELKDDEADSEKKDAPFIEQLKDDKSIPEMDFLDSLKPDEKNLFNAYIGLQNSIYTITDELEEEAPQFNVSPRMLFPNYKPSIGKIITKDIIAAWDIIIKGYPNQIKNLKPTSSDEEFLNFAESCENTSLTLAIISYVETIIEIEGCEISYQEKLLKHQRRQIEKAIREEHFRRQERIRNFIAAIEKKKFPINATQLVTNYFKTAKKDNEGAFKALTTNPAVFAPIEAEKIKPRFFGLIKPKPQDGFKINKIIAKFLKNLKA